MKIHIYILYMHCFYVSLLLQARDNFFIVLITSYNNARWYKKNLDSVTSQTYQNFKIIYVDDASTDGTAALVEEYIDENHLKEKIFLIKNETNKKKLANLYTVIHQCDDDDIIIELDGDDWLMDDGVLELFDAIYKNSSTWLAYAAYYNVNAGGLSVKKTGSCKKTARSTIQSKTYRRVAWQWSGLRSYYAWLFKLIRKKDLVYPFGHEHVGEFFKTSSDGATIYPMLEMAGFHAIYMPQRLLCRNIMNEINDFKVHKSEQQEMKEILRKNRRYVLLKGRPRGTTI